MFMLAGSVPMISEFDYDDIMKTVIVTYHIHNFYRHFKDGTLNKFLNKSLDLGNME